MTAYHDDRWDEVLAPEGGRVLELLFAFLGRFIAYPSVDAQVAHALWIVHTYLMDCWESTPRIAFLSPEPGSGKSRCLEVMEPLVPRPVHAVNTTPAYLFRKVSDESGAPTILYDEIDTVFGPKAKDNEDIRGMLNAGHRKGAMAGRCVMRGKVVETEELPAYCAVALAGLDDLPDTLMTRSVVVRMRRRAPGEQVEPWRLRVNGPEAERLRTEVESWACSIRAEVDGAWPEMPGGVEDRNADVWEPLLAVADAAGPGWADRARVAAVALVAQSQGSIPSLGVLLLRDLRVVFADREVMRTEDVVSALVELEESPWGDLRGREIDARGLARRLAKYDVKPRVHRIGGGTPRGYSAADLADAWSRYLPEKTDSVNLGTATHESATRATAQQADDFVAAVALVAQAAGPTGGMADKPAVTSVSTMVNKPMVADPVRCNLCTGPGPLGVVGDCERCRAGKMAGTRCADCRHHRRTGKSGRCGTCIAEGAA